MHRRTVLKSAMALTAAGLIPAALGGSSASAQGVSVTLTVGYAKVGHLAPIVLIEDELKKQGVELKLVEFARCIEQKRPYPVLIDEVLHGMAVFDAVVRSGKSQKIETVG